jgi:hypothetical protein
MTSKYLKGIIFLISRRQTISKWRVSFYVLDLWIRNLLIPSFSRCLRRILRLLDLSRHRGRPGDVRQDGRTG